MADRLVLSSIVIFRNLTYKCTTEQRERDIGLANRDNVQRLLASMALYPFIERLGYLLPTSTLDSVI